MINAELIITLQKNSDSFIKLYSFEYEGIEYVLTKNQIKDFENRYNVKVILNEKQTHSYNLEPILSNMDFISAFFSEENSKN